MTSADHRLASYGTLAPGKSNHKQVAHLQGAWLKGTVRGRRTQADWGQWIGFPGFVIDLAGDVVDVDIFESPDLPAHWDRLDAFEGEAYQRVAVLAQTDKGPMDVSIYTLRPAPES